MTGWHLDGETARRYASGATGQVFAASAEAHLAVCPGCRALLVPLVDRPRLDAIWNEVAERVDAPQPGPMERLLRRLGVRPDTARLLSATPSLSGSWLMAVAATLAFAVVAAGAGPRGTLLFLTLAPMLPVAGVAVAYGRGVDPVYEIGAAAPYSGFRLLLLRSAAVVATTTVLAGGAGLLLPVTGWIGAAWMLPALALTTLTLVLSVRFALLHAATGVAATWIVAVAATQSEAGGRAALADGRYAAFGTTGQLVCLILAVASIAVLALRHRRYVVVFGRTS
jgi:hypothetical protein